MAAPAEKDPARTELPVPRPGRSLRGARAEKPGPDSPEREARRNRRARRNKRPPAGMAAARPAFITALAYALVGLAALMLAGPPGYASPLYPAAGVALAAVLTWGRAALPGVLLGSFVVNLYLGWQRPQGSSTDLLLLPLVIGLGATAQAWLGAWLVQRYTRRPVLLHSPRDIALAGLLGAGVAGLVSASVAVPTLLAAGTLQSTALLPTWLTWWLGDALGVLIGAPIMLTLIGQPSADWRGRRLTVGLPLLLAMLLTGAAMMELEQRDRQNLRADFERDVDRLASDAQSRLQVPLYALQALHGIARAQALLDENALRAAARWWLQLPRQLQAMGYSVRVPRLDIERFETAVRANGLPDYRVFHRDEGAALASDDEVLAIRLIEPMEGNAAALGVNTLSIPAAREAVLQARRSGLPAATAGFRLTQTSPQAPSEVGVVIYQALYEGEPATDPERNVSFRGVVFVTLRAEAMLEGLAGPEKAHLAWCLVDPTADAAEARIAGPQGCEARPLPAWNYQTVRKLELGGRVFELRVDSAPGAARGLQRDGHTVLSLAAMASVAMLGALLLVVTGHSRRTELAVRNGTADLRREMAERGLAQQALVDSEERLRSILNHLPIGVMFLDPRGRLLECNPRLCEMLGESLEQLRGMTLVDLMHPDERRERMALRPAGSDLQSLKPEDELQPMRLQRSDGGSVWVQVSTTALREGADARGRRVGVVQDITEHMRLRDSERALERAEASSRAKSEFVSRMSHELRTPLNAMIGFAQLLGLDREPGLAEHQKDWTQQIQRAGWHLLAMINETLDLARIESGAVQLACEPVALAPLVQGARSLVSSSAAARRIEVTDKLAADAPAVLADATRLKQVLINLLSNAVKYNVDGGRVWISARAGAEGCVVIAVTDTGLGMTPEQLGGLFQPYNRLGRETSGIEGTGIGLVISRRLVELMGGTLEARSVAGKGSTFTLRLPAAAAAAVPEPPMPTSAEAPYQQRRVHYVEDNLTNVEVMRGVLLQRPQVRLDVSTNGLDALQNIRRHRPDLILLDMHLPDISGLELLRHLKDDPALALIPVVVVSADATPARLTEALTLGALNYITKPVDVGRFLALLDETLEAMDTRWG
jgi:PAS domain S-box-containing protein